MQNKEISNKDYALGFFITYACVTTLAHTAMNINLVTLTTTGMVFNMIVLPVVISVCTMILMNSIHEAYKLQQEIRLDW